MVKYEVRIWEKAEHWYFTTMVEATDYADAIRRAINIYSRRRYTVVSAVRA